MILCSAKLYTAEGTRCDQWPDHVEVFDTGYRHLDLASEIQVREVLMFSIDPSQIGQRSEPLATEIEKGAIRRFARALDDDNPIYWDVDAARALGYPNIVAPPTFAATLEKTPIPGLVLPSAGLIHGEQEFKYGNPILAGDVISVEAWLHDVKTRKGSRGIMNILEIRSEGRNQDGIMVFQARSVIIVSEGVA